MSETVVLVVSCDAYSDVWPVFFSFFKRNWSDCPYPVYLVTNETSYEREGVISLLTGPDVDWSSTLITALKKLSSDYVLLMLDDFLLDRKVNTERVLEFSRIAVSASCGSVRLVPKPPATNPYAGHPQLAVQGQAADYRASFQACIWNRSVLMSLLREGEDAWKAEMSASSRSQAIEKPFLALRPLHRDKWPMSYLNAVIKRKWTADAVRKCRELSIPIDLNRRAVCGPYDRFRQTRIFGSALTAVVGALRKTLGERTYERLRRNRLLRRIVY